MTQPDSLNGLQPQCPAIVFNFSQSLPEEIARFDSKGFYYKGEFIDDAGEVHRLLKQVLEGQLNMATPPPEPPTDEELSDLWVNYDGIVDLRFFVTVPRAVLNKWCHG